MSSEPLCYAFRVRAIAWWRPAFVAGRDHIWHVLLVEDNPAVCRATKLLLETVGYKVTTAESLSRALECALDSSDLDYLVTDYHLGGGDSGKDVVLSVRAMRGPDFKTVVMSGDTSSAVHAFDGYDHLCWVGKPVDPAQLLSVLENLRHC